MLHDKTVPEYGFIASSSLLIRAEELTEQNIDTHILQFVDLHRMIPDVGIRNYECSVSDDMLEMTVAQSKFALYFLGKMTPQYDYWNSTMKWEIHEAS